MQKIEFQNDKSVNIDLKEYFLKYLAFLHWIVLGVVISLTCAFFYLRYASEVYEVSNIIKILNNDNTGFKLPTDGLSIFGKSKVNLENEIEVLQSSLLIERIVDELDLQNVYYVKGTFKETEVGPDAPFYVKWIGLPEVTNNINTEIEVKITKEGFYINSDKTLKYYNRPYKLLGNTFSIHLKDTTKKDINYDDYVVKKIVKNYAIYDTKSKIAVSHVGEESELLRITVKSNNPQKSADISNKLAEVFNQDGINDRKMVYVKTIDFVNDRFAFLFKELDSIESNKAFYKKDNKLSFLEADAGDQILSKSGTNVELNAAKTQAILSDVLIETLNKTKTNDLLPANIGLDNIDINASIQQYNELVLQMQKLAPSIGENHPSYIILKDSQKELKRNLKNSLDTYKRVLLTKINSIEQISDGQSQKYAALPFQEKAIRSIERQQQIKETLYIILLQKREEAAVNLAIINPSIKMVDTAKRAVVPISPKPNIIYLVALLLGIGIPIGIVYLYLLMDTKIYTKDDVAAIVNDIPVIAEIPHILDGDKMVKYLDRSVLSEAFRILRTNLSFLLHDKDKSQIIFSTSTIKGEGKTFVSMNLAITLSTLGKKVIVVGADLRNPQLHKMLNISRYKKGVSNYLLDSITSLNDIIEKGDQFNLKCDFIFSGTIPPNPAELLSNGRFQTLLEELKKEYDYVIVDTAPTLLVTDTTLIANLADLVVFVIRANYTDKNLLYFINELKAHKKITNVGIVLNNVGEQKAYGYKYGYSYSYKYKYKYNYGYGYGYGNEEQEKRKKYKKPSSLYKKVITWIKSKTKRN